MMPAIATAVLFCLPLTGTDTAPAKDAAFEEVLKWQERILRSPEPTADDLEQLARVSVRVFRERHLKTSFDDPDALRSEGQIQFRRDVFGPLYDDTRALRLMRGIVEAPEADEWKAILACAMLADHGGDEDLRTVFHGLQFMEAGGAKFTSTAETYGRHLGRMLSLPPSEGSDAALRAEVAAALKSWLELPGSSPMMRGAALQAYFEAGDVETVSAWFRKMTAERPSDPCELLRLIPSSLRLTQHRRFPAELRDQLHAQAAHAVSAFLASPPARTVLTGSLEPVRSVRGAVRVLMPGLADADLDVVLPLLANRLSGAWLGIDLLQEVRWGLGRGREHLSAEGQARIDRTFLDLLLDDAALLRRCDRPLDQDERSAFLDRRDLRYNAASYLVDVLGKDGALADRIADHPDALEAFLALARAGLDPEAPRGMREKTETSVMLAELLARVAPLLGEEIDRELLQRLLVAQLQSEVGAAVGEAGDLPITIAQKKQPQDAWIKDHVIEALTAIGLKVVDGHDALTIERSDSGCGGDHEANPGS